jgi:hypothetical protein
MRDAECFAKTAPLPASNAGQTVNLAGETLWSSLLIWRMVIAPALIGGRGIRRRRGGWLASPSSLF